MVSDFCQLREGFEAFPATVCINKYAAALTDKHKENIPEVTTQPGSLEHSMQANATNMLFPRCCHCLSSGCAISAHSPSCSVGLRFKEG